MLRNCFLSLALFSFSMSSILARKAVLAEPSISFSSSVKTSLQNGMQLNIDYGRTVSRHINADKEQSTLGQEIKAANSKYEQIRRSLSTVEEQGNWSARMLFDFAQPFSYGMGVGFFNSGITRYLSGGNVVSNSNHTMHFLGDLFYKFNLDGVDFHAQLSGKLVVGKKPSLPKLTLALNICNLLKIKKAGIYLENILSLPEPQVSSRNNFKFMLPSLSHRQTLGIKAPLDGNSSIKGYLGLSSLFVSKEKILTPFAGVSLTKSF